MKAYHEIKNRARYAQDTRKEIVKVQTTDMAASVGDQ